MPEMHRAKKPIILVGMALLVMGFVFMLQGEGTIGPEASFMYADPDWQTNGKAIMLIGGATCLGGMFIRPDRSRIGGMGDGDRAGSDRAGGKSVRGGKAKRRSSRRQR